MANLDFWIKKSQKITKKISEQIHALFDSGINYSSDWWYRKVTYWFDADKYWLFTNHPRDYQSYTLRGLFYLKHINNA